MENKILILDASRTYAWIHAGKIGEILVGSHKMHKVDHKLCLGCYRLYEVINEPGLSDELHLELSIGRGRWQGYLLPTGFPNDRKKRNRIIPTEELISSGYTN